VSQNVIRTRVVLWVPDVFFSTRIREAARTLDVTVELPSRERFVEHCRSHPPDRMFIDLAAPGGLDLARELKSDPALASIPIVGFYPHVDQALRESALASRVDQVLPRSAFTARLPALLTGEPRTGC